MILNLTHKEKYGKCEFPKGEIEWEYIKFPDGQQSIHITPMFFSGDTIVKIISRLNSFQDLELILAATSALRGLGIKNISLYIPYLLGARSDRMFNPGDPHYLRDVIVPIINAQNFNNVTVLDPHSDVTEALVNNLSIINNWNIVKEGLTDIDNTDYARDNVTVISPDAGALKKIYGVVENFQIKNLIVASKHRDLKTGKITHTEVPIKEEHKGKKFVIIDDICDGGRTFIEIAKVIKNEQPEAEIYLIVTHGIFSKGIDELRKYFTKIYTTNSVNESITNNTDNFVKIINVL